MNIKIKGIHFDVSEALDAYTYERLEKMSKLSDNLISADVTLATERNWHIAEITVYGNGFDMHGQEKTKDMYSSIDRVTEKLERQLKKKKGKRSRSSRRPSRSPASAEPMEAVDEAKKHVKAGDKFAPRVDFVKSYLAYELTIDEAIKQMEAKGHDFFAFLNAENGRVNVIYKRDRGYGLVDPRVEDPEE